MHANVVIRDGLLADGSAGPPRTADVAIDGARIVAVGSLDGVDAATVIDAAGCVVLPGFVDAHVHAEGVLLSGGGIDGALLQGVTTMILGQDGTSFAPVATTAALRGISRYWSAVNGALPPSVVAPLTVGDFLSLFDGCPVNVAYLVPNGNLRLNALGWLPARADDVQLELMRRAVAEGLREGAVGLSSGLDYTPSMHADRRELSALCTELAAADVPYVTHMRGYGVRASEGIAEAVWIAKEAGVSLHISHFSGRIDQVVPHLDSAEAQGIDISFDSYPFVASSSILAMTALPRALRSEDPDTAIARLQTYAGRQALAEHLASPESRDVGAMVLAFVDEESFRKMEGLQLAAVAEKAGVGLADLVVKLLSEAGFGVAIIDPRAGAFSEEDIVGVSRDHRHMVGSDGAYVGSHPHVRSFSAFAKFIDIAVTRGALGWGEAVQHLATRAARRFRLEGRGVVQAGAYADIVVLRPTAISYADDVQRSPYPARGVEHVFVNGSWAVAGGRLTGARGGRALRRSDSAR